MSIKRAMFSSVHHSCHCRSAFQKGKFFSSRSIQKQKSMKEIQERFWGWQFYTTEQKLLPVNWHRRSKINAHLRIFTMSWILGDLCLWWYKHGIWNIMTRSQWTLHWSPKFDQRAIKTPKGRSKDDQREAGSNRNARAIRIWPCNFDPPRV